MTTVVAQTVWPGREREADRWISRLERAVGASPWFLGAASHRPDVTPPTCAFLENN